MGTKIKHDWEFLRYTVLVGVRAEQWIKGSLRVLWSPTEPHGGDGIWKHASISCKDRYPTWDEILSVRYKFFSDTDEVIQVLPPKDEYINLHKNCFHLWSPWGKRISPV